jgi:O-antigen/teichoic acid export membrane protein
VKFTSLRREGPVRHAGTVLLGGGLAQALSLAVMPLLTRLYGAEAFGIMGLFVAISAILTPVCTGRYNLAVVLPDSRADASQIAVMACILTMFTALAFVLLLPVAQWLASELGSTSVSTYLFLIPVMLILIGCAQTLESWAARESAFRAVSSSVVAGAVTGNGTKLALGLAGFGPLGLILGTLATHATSLLTLALSAGPRALRLAVMRFRIGRAWPLARRYSHLPTYRVPNDVLNALSHNAPILLLAVAFGPVEVGCLWLAMRVLQAPTQLGANSVRKVFYPWATRSLRENRNLRKSMLSATLYMALIAALPAVAVVTLAPAVFEYIFGAEWRLAGQYAQWLAIWLFFAFINAPAVSVIPVFKLERFFLMYELGSICLRVGGLAAGLFIFHDDQLAVLLYSIAAAGANAFLILFVARVSE